MVYTGLDLCAFTMATSTGSSLEDLSQLSRPTKHPDPTQVVIFITKGAACRALL